MKLTLDSDDHHALQLIEEIARRMGLNVTRNKEWGKSSEVLQQEIKELQKMLKETPPVEKKYPLPDNDRALKALEKLSEYGTFNSIQDPVEWQREIRKDKPLTGRND